MGDVLDITSYLRFAAALVAVLALILVAAHLAKRFLPGGAGMSTGKGKRRLAVSEALTVDARRRLLLVKRDGREHLILTGPTGDLLVERDIDAAQGGLPAHDAGENPPAATAGDTTTAHRVLRLFGGARG